jgi:uncharacterized protein YjbI with pentapeptide repeats
MANKPDPFDVEALEIAVNDSATRVSAIWISFLVFSLYLLIAATTVTQLQLLLAQPITLPVLNIALPLWGFFFLAPIMFVILHVYTLLQVLLLGRTTSAYNDAVARLELSPEENISLRQRLANTLFAQIFAGSPREREGFIGWLLRSIVWITLAIAPILVVLAFQFSFLAYHSHIATWTHRLLILVEIAVFFLIWPLALDARKNFQSPNVWADLKALAVIPLQLWGPKEKRHDAWLWLREHAIPLIACIFYLLVPLSLATFPGEPHVNLFTGKALASVHCERWLLHFKPIDLQFDRLDLPRVDVIDHTKLERIDKATEEAGEHPGEPTFVLRNRDLNCSDLYLADLRRVDLSGSSLRGAWLAYARLKGASLASAHLQGAYLGDAQLQGADLSFAQFQGADLSAALLQGARLTDAQLQGARLSDAQFQGADLSAAQLQGADLSRAQLQGAVLRFTILEATSLGGAQLQGADLTNALLQGADFWDANLDHSVLSSASTWRARNAACSNARATDLRQDTALVVIPVGVTVGMMEQRMLGPNPPSFTVTPDTIEEFIKNAIAEIPDANKALAAAARMRKGLIGDPEKDDAQVIGEVWRNCEVRTSSIPQEKFDNERAGVLRSLICNPSEDPAIGESIIHNWLSYPERPVVPVQLARSLLDQKACATTKNFSKSTMRELSAAAGRAR